MENTQFQIDPTEIDDEIDIEVDPIEEGDKPSDIDDEITDDTDDGFFDSDEDSDDSDDDSDEEEKPVVKKAIKPKTEKKVKDDDLIRRKPLVGHCYKSQNILIQIIAKRGNKYDCKVLSVIPPSRREKGEMFEAEEVAFYSEYYEYAGIAK